MFCFAAHHLDSQLSHLKLTDLAATESTRFLPEFSVLENSNQLKDESNNTKSHKRNSTIWNPPSGHQVDLRGHRADSNHLVATSLDQGHFMYLEPASAPPYFSFPEEPMRNGWYFLVVGNIIRDVNPEPLLMFKTHFSGRFLTSPGAFKSFQPRPPSSTDQLQ